MSISSDDVRSHQFSGTEHSYDAAEVEEFRQRVVEALATHEVAAEAMTTEPVDVVGGDSEDTLAAAQRVRQQAVHLAERMLRDVMGASEDDTGSLATWQEAAMLRALAEEEMAFAREEARRLPAMAAAERDLMHAKYEKERTAVRRELQNELQASRAAAMAEAEQIRATASAEAANILSSALEKAAARQNEAAAEMHRRERRMEVLKTGLADAEARFRRLAATAANELGTLSAIADQDISAPTQPELRIAEVDLTDATLDDVDEAPSDTSGFVKMDPEAGFYQRRLAGLRDRLEKSGHPPGD